MFFFHIHKALTFVVRNNCKSSVTLDIGYNTNTTIGGLNGLIENILEVLPQDEIFILFFEKLEKSIPFNNFIASIGNPEFVRKYMVLWVSTIWFQLFYLTAKEDNKI